MLAMDVALSVAACVCPSGHATPRYAFCLLSSGQWRLFSLLYTVID